MKKKRFDKKEVDIMVGAASTLSSIKELDCDKEVTPEDYLRYIFRSKAFYRFCKRVVNTPAMYETDLPAIADAIAAILPAACVTIVHKNTQDLLNKPTKDE